MPPRTRVKKVDYTQYLDPNDVHDDDIDDDNDVQMDDIEDQATDEEMSDTAEVLEDDDHLGNQEGDSERVLEKKSRSKKSTTKSKPSVSEKKNSNHGNGTPKTFSKNARNMTSLRDKFYRIFGSNEEKLLELLKLRKQWESSVFDFQYDQLANVKKAYSTTNIPEIKFAPLTESQFNHKFNLERSINLQFDDENVKKVSNNGVLYNKRGIVLYTGGLNTDIVWLDSDSSEQLLAISVSNKVESTIYPEFKFLSKAEDLSAILIYKINTQTKKVELFKSILHNWGNSWGLKVAPIQAGLGVISAVFNDGNVRLLKIEDDGNKFLDATEASITYSLPDKKLSAFDWFENKILAGTTDGFITEFIIEDSLPSFVYPLQSGTIFSIKSGENKYGKPLFLSASSSCSSVLFSLDDIQASRNQTSRSRVVTKALAYSPQLYSFIQTEGPFSAKLIASRALFINTPVVKHDGSTESLSTSSLHPMLLSGGADGRIKLGNLARKLLNGKKQSQQGHKILQLWTLSYGRTEDTYRLDSSLNVETLNSNDSGAANANIYPPNVSIAAIKWNENLVSGKWYAATSTLGIVVMEELGSSEKV